MTQEGSKTNTKEDGAFGVDKREDAPQEFNVPSADVDPAEAQHLLGTTLASKAAKDKVRDVIASIPVEVRVEIADPATQPPNLEKLDEIKGIQRPGELEGTLSSGGNHPVEGLMRKHEISEQPEKMDEAGPIKNVATRSKRLSTAAVVAMLLAALLAGLLIGELLR